MYNSVQHEVLNKGTCSSEAIQKTSFKAVSELSSGKGWKERGQVKGREGTCWVERTVQVRQRGAGSQEAPGGWLWATDGGEAEDAAVSAN